MIRTRRNNKARRLKAVFLIGLMLCLASTALCGCSILSADTQEYNSDKMIEGLENALYNGKTQYAAEYSKQSLSSVDLQAELNQAMETSYPLSCMLEDISVSAENGLFSTRAVFKLDYNDNAEGAYTILNVSGEVQLRDTLAEFMKKNAPKTALLLSDYEFSEESISALLNEADINCDESAYEYKNIYYAFYEKVDDRQLVIIWGECPVAYPENIEKKAELAVAAARHVSSVKESQPTNNTAAYELIYDLISDASSYDDNLADISSSDPDSLTPEMLRDRTAYGALITGSTVCSGYSRAYKYICDELSLPCYIVTGDCDGMRHAWNAVSVDGKTLYIDCTSGDEGGFGKELFLFTESQAQALGYVQDESCNIPF